MRHNNLIIVRAGANSLHSGWLNGAAPAFDVLVAAYHPDAMSADTERVKHRFFAGSKVAGWRLVLGEQPDLLDRYERIALVDDDIAATAATFNRCFAIGEKYGLDIWQPALSGDSYITYAASLQHPQFQLRFCNYIEMMCPFFQARVLRKVAPLFSMGYESGIDLVWCSIANEDGGACAIVDECVVRHTRPVGVMKDLNGFIGRRYESDIYACLECFDMRWPSWVVTGAVSRNEKPIDSKFILSLSAAAPLLGLADAPPGARRYRLKAALDYLRHQLTRRPYFGTGVSVRLAAE